MFYLVIVLFALESLWIALTARYPMAFDEYAHYGIAQLYTHTWSPFLSHVPDSASVFGPVSRDPSFLYHYLISFPLRILQLFTDSQTWQIILLRIFNIFLAMASLFVYSRLLLRLGVSRLKTNLTLLIFILIPVVPLMAGQITYDNLFFLFVATDLLLAVGFVQQYQRHKTINVSKLNWLLIVGLFTCFIKYAYVPALATIVVFLAIWLRRQLRTVLTAYRDWWRQQAKWHKSLTIIAMVIGLWFFVGSYGLNVVRYHNPLPDCDVVLNVDACKAYGPWYRDYQAKQAGGHAGAGQIPWYVQRWTRQMMRETFFLVGAKYNDKGVVVYYAKEPIAVMFITAWLLLVAGVAVLVRYSKQLWKRPDHRLILLVIGFYSVALFGLNLQFYLETGQPVAIHGRYLLPFIPPLVGLVAVALQSIKRRPSKRVQTTALVVICLLFLQGGGLITYIVSSNDGWMWPQSRLARQASHDARQLISPLVYRR